VALDQASADLVNQAPILVGSKITDHHPHYDPSSDRFFLIHPHTNWQEGLAYAEAIGLGTRQYDLIRLDS
ncbi:MAG: 4Fe-4S ferredoxin, partial [Brevinematales bacterium]